LEFSKIYGRSLRFFRVRNKDVQTYGCHLARDARPGPGRESTDVTNAFFSSPLLNIFLSISFLLFKNSSRSRSVPMLLLFLFLTHLSPHFTSVDCPFYLFPTFLSAKFHLYHISNKLSTIHHTNTSNKLLLCKML
jgi:hypothetical protein